MIDKLTPRTFKSDQDERLTPPTAFVDALNITLDDDDEGNAGVAKNIKGTSTVTDLTGIDYAGETVEVLGTCRDSERGRTYIFVYCSSASKQAILQYTDSTNALTTVLNTTFLTFRSGDAVVANVVNGDFRRDSTTQSLLYFTDNNNPPRKINVDKAGEYQGISSSDLRKRMKVIKGTSLRAPRPWLLRDTTISSVSNFQRGSFQFAFQYVYKDGEVSALSPYSKYVFGQKRIEPSSTISTIENVCKILIPMNEMTSEVLKIRLLYRENNGYEVSPFRIIDEFDPSQTIRRNLGNVSDYVIFQANSNVYTFLNNGYNGFLPSSEEDRPFSNVPKRAKTQTITNSRLVYGNYIDGYDNLSDPSGVEGSNGELPNVDFEVSYQDLPSDTGTTTNFPSATPVDEDIVVLEDQTGVNISGGNTVRISFTPGASSSDTPIVNVGNSLNKFFTSVAWSNDDGTPDLFVRDSFGFVINEFEVEITLEAQQSILSGNDSVRERLNDQLQDFSISGDGNTFVSGTSTVTGHNVKVFFNYTLTPKLFNSGGDLVLRYVADVDPHSVLDQTENELYFVDSYVTGFGDEGLYNTYGFVDQNDGEFVTENPNHFASFTSGSNHTIALSYIDSDGRYGPAQEVGSFYVEPIGSGGRTVDGVLKNGPCTVKMTPSHTPPSWAERYAILYAGPDDIEDAFDMYVDDATMIRKTTKSFPFEKPDSVFINITSYVESMQRQGIDFASAYRFEPGDYVRVVSKRNTLTNGDFDIDPTNVTDGSGGTSSFHSVTDATTFWSDLTTDLRPAGAGTTVDFPVLGVHDISGSTDLNDYAFGANAIGEVVPGTYLELEVPRNAVGWGSDNFQFLAGPHERRTVGGSNIIRNIIGDGGASNTGVSGIFQSWWGAIGINQADAGDGDLSDYNDNWSNASQIPWRVLFRDLDNAAEADSLKPLHRHSAWDKGVRIHLIKPKDHSKSRVYHEIGVTKSFDDKAASPPNPHGHPEHISDGYSWFRKVDSSDPFEGVSTIPVIAWTADPSLDASTIGFEGTSTGTVGAMDDPTRTDTIVSSYGGRVRPIENKANHIVESFYTFPGSLEKVRNIGRLNVTSLDGEKRRESSLIHSNFFGSETLTLTVHDFEATSFKDLDVNNGAINALTSADQYLTVFQNSKVSKVPVNRNILQTASGNESLSVSNLVLGAEQSYSGQFGVDTNQCAVISVGGVSYFIDRNRRAIVRISNNGMNIISDIDISRMIEETFVSNSSSSANYALGYDRERDYVFFTFQGNETYGYDHKKKVWTSKYSFNPLAYGMCETDMLSFELTSSGDICHRHDNEDQPGNFYGVNAASKISLISNGKNASMVKSYNAMGLESTQPMDVKIKNTTQSVSFEDSRFTKKESFYYTDLPFDSSHRVAIYGYLDEADITDAQKEDLVEYVNPDEIKIVGFADTLVASSGTAGFPNEQNNFDVNSRGYGLKILQTESQYNSLDLTQEFDNNPGSQVQDVTAPAYSGMTTLAFLYKGKWRIIDSLFRSAIGFGNPAIDYEGDPGSFQGGEGLLQNSTVVHIMAQAITSGLEYYATYPVVLGLGHGHLVSPRTIPNGVDGGLIDASNAVSQATYEKTIRDFLTEKGIVDDFTSSGEDILVAFVQLDQTAFGTDGNPALQPSYTVTAGTPTIGGKKIRDYYAKVDLTSAGDGKKFELHAVNLDFDDSKIHM